MCASSLIVFGVAVCSTTSWFGAVGEIACKRLETVGVLYPVERLSLRPVETYPLIADLFFIDHILCHDWGPCRFGARAKQLEGQPVETGAMASDGGLWDSGIKGD